MKVLLMPSSFWPHKGGVEELTLKLAQHLLGRGHYVLVLTNKWPRDLPSVDTVEGVDVRRLSWTLPARRPRSRMQHWSQAAALTAEAAAIAAAFDVVHVQCPSSQTYFARRAAEATGRPLIVTTQGETVMDAGQIYQRNGWLRRELVRSSQAAVALTACSSWTAAAASATATRFVEAQVIFNGVDAADWFTVGEPPREPRLVAWGRHVPQKGFDLLLSAFERLQSRIPEASLVVGGDGPERGRLQAMAVPGVSFIGGLDRKGVRELLMSARVAVVPSRIEPFGIVALEALAAGRGLVYSTRGGLAEAAGACGRGADPYDSAAFSLALEAELKTPARPADGRNRAAQLSWSAIGREYELLYERSMQLGR